MNGSESADREPALWRQRATRPASDRADADVLVRRQRNARAGAQDVTREIEVAAEAVGRRDLGSPVDAPDGRGVMRSTRNVEPFAEWPFELMAPVGCAERFAIEAVAVDRSADDERAQRTVAREQVRPERLVVVPQAEIALDVEMLLPLAAPREQELRSGMHANRAVDLHAAPPVVIANALSQTDRGEARLGGRDLPLIVAGREVVHFTADVQLRRPEHRTLEAERISGSIRRRLEREMTEDVRVIELVMIEDRRTESERRHESVDRREPVLAIAEIRDEAEAARRLAEADEQHATPIAIDEIKSAAASAEIADIAKIDASRPDGAARLPQQHLERLHRSLPVEHVAPAQRELVGEPLRDAGIVDAFELDAVDDPLVDLHRQRSGRSVERHVGVREGVPIVLIAARDGLGHSVRRFGQRGANLNADRAAEGLLGELVSAADRGGANCRLLRVQCRREQRQRQDARAHQDPERPRH